MKRWICFWMATILLIGVMGGLSSCMEQEEPEFVYEMREEGTYELKSYSGEEMHVTIPDTYQGVAVTHIAEEAFYGNVNMLSVTIGRNVIGIEDNAFDFCEFLVEVCNNSSMPLTTEDFEELGARNVKHIYTSQTGTTHIYETDEKFIFYADDEEVYLLRCLEDTESLVLPTSYEGRTYAIFAYAFDRIRFEYERELLSIAIPSAVTEIGTDAFLGCKELDAVYITDLAAWCEIDFLSKFGGFSRDSNPLSYANHLYVNGEKITDMVIPDGVEKIKEGAFAKMKGLTSVVIPKSVKACHAMSFYACPDLNAIYYLGTAEDLKNITFVDLENNEGFDTSWYIYSEEEPEAGNTSMRYWHYVNDVPTKW